MAEGRHVSKAEIDEMERRKRDKAERGDDSGRTSATGEHEQQADLDKTQKRKRIIDPSLTINPD